MPITITIPPTGGALSPGQQIAWNSDFTGPLQVGSSILVKLSTDVEGTRVITSTTVPTQLNHGQYVLMDQSAESWLNGAWALAAGANATLSTELHDGSAGPIVDSGAQTYVWQPESNVGLNIKGQGGSSQGGLTPQESLQLQETHDQSFLGISLDTLLLTDLTPLGPSPGPVNAQLPGYTFGVIVRLGNIDIPRAPQTPDDAYWVPTLATVRLFRGSDLWLRVPIHTPSKIIPFAATDLAVALATATVGQWILNLTIQVNFLPGVTGKVFLMKTP